MRNFSYFCSMKTQSDHKTRVILTIFVAIMQFCVVHAEAPFNLGLRAGFNTSNITEQRILSGKSSLNDATWKQGVTVGAVIDIPLSSKISLQPGFFFDQRTSKFASSYFYEEQSGDKSVASSIHIEGSTATNWFHIPLMASYKIAPVRSFQINLDLGAYIAFGLSGANKQKIVFAQEDAIIQTIPDIKHSCFTGDNPLYFQTDWGFKAGGGFQLFRHYYIGAHYIFGIRDLSRNKEIVNNAYTRQWQFTLGYNF